MSDKKITRRKFLTRVGLGGMLASIGLCIVGVLRFFYLNVFYERSNVFKIGRGKDYPVGTSTLLPDYNVYVFRDMEGIYVISAVCPHLGCIVSEEPERFECPCHGSVFNLDGQVVKGPAPTALKWFRIAESPDGYLVVDKRKAVTIGTKFKYA